MGISAGIAALGDALAGAATDVAVTGAVDAGIGAAAGAAADVGGTVAAADLGAAALGGAAEGGVAAGLGATDLAAGAAEGGLAAGAGLDALAGGAGGGAGALGGVGADVAGTAAGGAGAGAEISAPAATAAGLGASGGVVSPTEALAGGTGPLSALGGSTPTNFDTLWAADQAALAGSSSTSGLTPAAVSEAAYGFPAGETAGTGPLSYAATTENGAAGLTPGAGAALSTGGTTTAGATLDEVALANNATLGTTAGVGAPTSIAPAAAGTAGGAAPAAGGISGTLNSILASPTLKAAEVAAPLAGLGYTLVKGQPSLPPAAQRALDNVGPTQNFADTELSNAASNTISPAQQAQIDQYVQNAKNQLYQFYASQGRDPNQDTDFLQGMAQIEQNAIAMQQQFINTMITTGLQAQGQVSSELNSAAQMQMANDQQFQASITSALQSFGLVAAISNVGQKQAA
jgi:hypothetical protein